MLEKVLSACYEKKQILFSVLEMSHVCCWMQWSSTTEQSCVNVTQHPPEDVIRVKCRQMFNLLSFYKMGNVNILSEWRVCGGVFSNGPGK